MMHLGYAIGFDGYGFTVSTIKGDLEGAALTFMNKKG